MAVVETAKILILGHKSIKNEVLKYLQEAGLLQIVRTDQSLPQTLKEEKVDYDLDLAELKSSIEFLEQAEGKKKNLLETFAPTREIAEEEELTSAYKEFDWEDVIKKIKSLEVESANLSHLTSKLKGENSLLMPWKALEVKLKDLTCTQKTCILPGRLKAQSLEDFKRKLLKFSPRIEIRTVNQDRGEAYLLIFYLSEEEKTLSDLIQKTEFSKVLLPASERTVKEEIEQHHSLIRDAEEQKKSFSSEAYDLIKYKSRLMQVYDYLYLRKIESEAKEKLVNTPHVFILEGWIRRPDFNKLKDKLRRISPALEVQEIAPSPGEIPPTIIENPKPLVPFELITRIFGLPSRGEMDPTAPLSFFYLLFFAICLSDAGYGVILAVLSLYLLKKLQLTEGGKNLMKLLFWGGILTVFAGIFTGSYFSINLDALPPGFLKNLVLSLRLIDPIKNPLQVLILSLFVGVIQNLFGLTLALYWKIKNKDYLTAILDYGLWIFFLASLVALVAALAVNSALSRFFSWSSISGAALLVLTQGRGEKTIFKKAVFGILSLYRTTSYLGDTLSYSRLLALMMTTSIIGMVINILADLTRNSVPFLGYVIMVAILLIGHAFNLVVSTLGAFIHSMRLQLVEFFGKFYEGGGKAFKPFKRETKYVLLKEEII